MLRYTTDRARPGLVALYDIRPGNGAGQFLQPRSPHGAITCNNRSIPDSDEFHPDWSTYRKIASEKLFWSITEDGHAYR